MNSQNSGKKMLTGNAARAAIERKIRYLQRRIDVTASKSIKKWAQRALEAGRYVDCSLILRVECRTEKAEYDKWKSWLQRTIATLN